MDKLSEIREYNRIAKQKSRANQKRLKAVNDKSMTSQPCQDTEEERDKDKEKESHSFIPRACEEESVYDSQRTMLGGTLGQGVVFISEEQMADLLDKLSLDEFEKYVAIVRDCELNGKPFKKKTHYQAILDMAMKDRKVRG